MTSNRAVRNQNWEDLCGLHRGARIAEQFAEDADAVTGSTEDDLLRSFGEFVELGQATGMLSSGLRDGAANGVRRYLLQAAARSWRPAEHVLLELHRIRLEGKGQSWAIRKDDGIEAFH